jgi:hypothetical protein
MAVASMRRIDGLPVIRRFAAAPKTPLVQKPEKLPESNNKEFSAGG